MNCIDKLKEVSAFLKSSGIEYAAKEAEIILTETLQINKTKLYTADSEISDEMSRHIDSIVEKARKKVVDAMLNGKAIKIGDELPKQVKEKAIIKCGKCNAKIKKECKKKESYCEKCK